MTLEESTQILELYETDDEWAYYQKDEEEVEPEDQVRVRVPLDTYVDMGRPDVITVTVAPGDHLNGDEVRDA